MGNTGYILDVVFEYPKQLHDLCNNCHLAPEVMNVDAKKLSEKQVEIYKLINEKNEPNDEKAKKLILILNAKDERLVKNRTLQFHLGRIPFIQWRCFWRSTEDTEILR